MAGDWVTDVTASVQFPKVKLDKSESKKAQQSSGAAFVRGLQAGMEAAELEIQSALGNALQSNIWGPYAPKQDYVSKGGQTRTSGYRNLVDTGDLQASLVMKTEFLKTKGKINISYNSPYAAITHYGGVIQPWGNPKAAPVMLPARPWVQYAIDGGGGIEPLDLSKVFSDAMEKHWP